LNIKYEEEFDKVVPSVLILDEDSGKYERIALFERNSPYQKKYKEIVFEEFDSLSEIAEEIEKDYNENKNFYKVRIMAKKFMTEISKIENGRKKFPFTNLEALSKFLEKDYSELKNLYVADKLVEEANKYKCSDSVFTVAESQFKYLRNKNVKQGKINF
jgi:hypothetical protein